MIAYQQLQIFLYPVAKIWNTAQHCPAQWRCLTNSSYSLLTVHAIFSSPIVQTLAQTADRVTWSVWTNGSSVFRSRDQSESETPGPHYVSCSRAVASDGPWASSGYWHLTVCIIMVTSARGVVTGYKTRVWWWNMYLLMLFHDDFVNVL